MGTVSFYEGVLHNQSQVYPRLFRNFHRQVFCWLDEWYGMTMEDIRRLEAEAKEELDRVCCVVLG